MSDPITVISTIVSAATGAVDNSGLPSPAANSAQAAVESAGEAAKSFTVQLDNAIARLPEPTQQTARQAVDDTSERVADMLPVKPPAAQSDTQDADVVPGTEPQLGRDSEATVQPAPQADVDSTPRYSTAPQSFAIVPVSPAAAVPAPVTGDIAVFVPWFRQAGALCSGIQAPTLAALYQAENGFRYGPSAPISPAGAMGPGQFMPATWAKYGRDVHGDGVPDVLDVGDSVMASGHLLCDTYQQIEGWKHVGVVSGDTLALTLAAYNAGAGAVLRSGGMPSGSPAYELETKPYVARILAARKQFEWLSADDYNLPAADHRPLEDLGRRIIAQAVKYLGLPYVWGGGGSNGPSSGGFDCSGLTSFAVHAATGGAVTLPRTSQNQWHVGTEIPLSQAVPGDLLFGNWGADGPGHVAIYLGNGRMVHAPTTGDVVRISPVMTGMRARHIGPDVSETN
ncbi:Peptidoglycan endopeptidase RipA [Nocardia cerradoensis]|uniref:Peptidoglycan endopeptidase RipA n=1 Tax=Nocardia cerradoensis TaxID=85688 RepID=A0A231GXL6_9NOCA|nr:NlpC/P60 family protein [Nocardia cerradoensis]OXR41261.1 Peptidoglycan endopeptidase RipA [Nocardia cerradoensis]